MTTTCSPTRPLRSESDTDQERNNLLEARRVLRQQLESVEAALRQYNQDNNADTVQE